MPISSPVEIDQRAARIAGVDRRVRLDEEAVVAGSDLGARERGDDPLRHRLADAERIADRDDEIADLERVGIAHLEHRKIVAALDAQHGEIGARIAQRDLGVELALVRQRDPHVGHVFDHVIVGHDQARRIDEDARPERLLHPLALVPAAAEEPLENRIVEQGIARRRLDPRRVDVDDRGRGLLHDRREGETHLGRALRRGLLDRVGQGGGAEEREDDGEREADQTEPPGGTRAALI